MVSHAIFHDTTKYDRMISVSHKTINREQLAKIFDTKMLNVRQYRIMDNVYVVNVD